MNQRPTGLNVTKAITGFLQYKSAEGLSPVTVTGYDHDLKLWIEYQGDMDVAQVETTHILAYLNYLRTDYVPRRITGNNDKKLSPKTVYNLYISVASFFTWASREFQIHNPVKGVPRPRVPEDAPVEPFKKEEIELLIKACDFCEEAVTDRRRKFIMQRSTSKRDKAILLTLLDTGLRAGELCALRVGDVDMKTGKIRVRPGEAGKAKGGKGRVVYLEHPESSKQKLAEAVGRSKSWVKKWLHRIRDSTLEDWEVLNGHSRARKRPPTQVVPEVVERILDIRDHPPQKLGRTPGPLTILHYLRQDQNLAEAGVTLPRSTRTIWKILDRHHRILRPTSREHEAEERPEPGVAWGMDFHDVSSVPADPERKQQHVVEILNLVDHGSSAVVASERAKDYTAETALRTVADVLVEQGCPERIRLDRDPRWVGSWTAKDFPSPLLRFLQCLGIDPHVCPPQRPDKNPFVERYHRNFKYECQLINPPHDLTSTVDINRPYVHFYNFERPNQALTCGNQPPLVKIPHPPHLSPVPQTIDPDRWLLALTGKTYKRRLDRNGCFQLGNQIYYVQKKLHGHYVIVWVNGQRRELAIFADRQLVKKLPIKGLQNRLMNFPDYLELRCSEAFSAWRRILRRTPTYRQVTM